MTDSKPPTIAFVGMTHLGLVSASAAAGKGFPVVCFDPDAELIGRMASGDLPIVEPGLNDLVKDNGARQRFTASLCDLAACDVVYIAPDVPTDDTGKSDLTGIRALVATVTPHLSATAILVILCQVPPGFTRGLDFPKDRLFYQVETLVFGIAVQRASEPERYIVGCAAPEATLPDAYRTLLEAHHCAIVPMRYESAELAKISINMCLVASISVANTMAELCENVGADWSEIAPSLKLDRRIGPYSYLSPGLGIAGGNLERDLATVIRLAGEHDTDAGVVEAWIANARHRRDWVVRTVQALGIQDKTLAVWGLAYKENTHSVKNSPSLATLAQLPDAALRVHDPVVPPTAVGRADAVALADPMVTLDGADALLILTPWPIYRKADPRAISERLTGNIVIDPYRTLDPVASRNAGLDWRSLGVPVDPIETETRS
ncbi:UDP-glucose/GDP-mannose dehydrogenase family protein [Rhodospirillaceae bacterium KN72]|uniref:UDP-glucose 6-dehydrogenase n=1 Tax=Pacificispira spongiicola TaxID=2729598 RepID=A0A7Y0E3X9_9PROT|nr:nucleotide sugar dehydrogenase [Pacificispira spongiicola]NMM46713.1 UDP-glucose/GDP-mannose dehydrogenase family protein [Pacificispira spongiicola]